MRRPSLQSVGMFAVGCVAAFGLFAFMAQAPHQGERLEKLTTQAQATPRNATLPQLPVTICRAPLSTAVASAGRSMTRRAIEAGVVVEALQFEALDQLLPAGVTGAKLILRVSGDEAGLTRFVKTSAAAQESIFIDRGEISIGAGGVEAEFQGRLLCRRGL